MAERTKPNAVPSVKCSRTSCIRKTRSPKASGWMYVDATPSFAPHLVGWMCPQCVKSLQKLLAEHGITPTVERLN
jgi:hypothetical protein